MRKPIDYVVDLQTVRTEFESIPPEIRRPSIVVSDEYHDDETFDMEIQSILCYLKDRRFAGEMLSRYTQDIIDNFEVNVEDYPMENKLTIGMAVEYARIVTQLGENLWRFFIDNELYNHDEKLIGEYVKFADGRWLVLRRK